MINVLAIGLVVIAAYCVYNEIERRKTDKKALHAYNWVCAQPVKRTRKSGTRTKKVSISSIPEEKASVSTET